MAFLYGPHAGSGPAGPGARRAVAVGARGFQAVRPGLAGLSVSGGCRRGRALPGGVVFCYRHDGELVGYNICLEHGGMLIDKYIGLRYPQARELDLYFVSWFVNLEHALERGLRFYVAGWTDPEVKAGLGARFTFTRHLVWVRNPILRRILYMFRHWFESDAKAVGVKAADKDTDHA